MFNYPIQARSSETNPTIVINKIQPHRSVNISPSQTMSNPTQNPTSTPNNSIANNHPTNPQSVANLSSTEDILMQDPNPSSHENLTDKFIASMVKARAKEARLRIGIAELGACIAPLENYPEFPSPEDMKKSALAKSRTRLLKAQRKLRHLLQREFRATAAMGELLGEKLAVAHGEVVGSKVALRDLRKRRSGKPIARGAAHRSRPGPGTLGGWGNMMPVTSHAARAARQQLESAESAEDEN